ncbi:MAG TPA: hypothetical protein VJ864_01430 [Candidatus Binatia bacterium]|jgi:hypothetical protein|nr:hypothetical protein [Candidatus Binatia bacterium]
MSNYIRYWHKAIFVGIIVLSLIPATWAADSGPTHRVDQQFPIQLGTSGGNINDSSKGFCYGGTLGALVEDVGGNQYILSNNHVLARTNAAAIGEDIIQPGLIDQSPTCFKDTSDAVADLFAFIPILFKTKGTMPSNSVDAAIAQIRAGKVDPTGFIMDIGTLSSDTVAPSLGMAVKKSGRTTGLTHGNITAVNATIDVSFGSGKTARFADQIVVGSGNFITGGDSGSLMVEDEVTNPRAIGLLFAGSSNTAIANPIDEVLEVFGVSMVGSGPSASIMGKILAWAKTILSIAEIQAANAQLPPQASQAAVDAVKRVKERHEAKLLAIPGVIGVGVGVSEKTSRQAAIEVYVKEAGELMHRALPKSLEGVEVKIIKTGEIRAY